jgi:hypothetical protein
MGHTHFGLEVELGYSHLLSTMEIASSMGSDGWGWQGQMKKNKLLEPLNDLR